MAVLLAVLIAVLAGLFAFLRQNIRKTERSPVETVYGVPLHAALIPIDPTGCRPGTKRKIQYIVIHETANASKTADAAAHSRYLMNGGDGSTSWHYTVDDHEIYQHIPDTEVAWHAGESDGNQHGIAVELCVNAGGDFDKTFDNGARLAAYLLNAYDLPMKNLRQHHDFSGKNCPQTIREAGRWDVFVKRVEQYRKETVK